MSSGTAVTSVSSGNFVDSIDTSSRLSSSFSDLGDFNDEGISASAPFSTIQEEQLKCDDLDLFPGEILRSRVENTAYIIYYAEVEEEESNLIETTPPVSPQDTESLIEREESWKKHKSFANMDAAGHEVNTSNRFHVPNPQLQSNATVDATRSLGRGLFRASTSVGHGILKGATGLVSQTYEGGSTGGIFGFAKGLGMGVLGFGTHTVKGAFRGVGQVTNVVGEMFLGAGPHFSLDGFIALTNYRILWVSKSTKDSISIPVAAIRSLEYGATATHVLNIECKSLMRPSFAFEDEELCYGFISSLVELYDIPYAFAGVYASAVGNRTRKDSDCDSLEGRGTMIDSAFNDIYDAERDYKRLGLIGDDSGMQIIENDRWKKFPSYPKFFILPTGLGPEEIEEVANYRSARRIPAVVWRHPITKATISRCSQPCVGLSGFISAGDQKLVELLQTGATFHFIDARSQIAAAANVANGKGTEDVRNYPNTELHHCDIGNIHAVRSSYGSLAVCCQPGCSRTSVKWVEELEQTQWLMHISQILKAVVHCCRCLEQGDSIMIHCSDGWDRTPQLTALTQLMLDPHYRTMCGIIELIEKEWCSFGHMFRTRYSHYERPNEQETEEQSPVFIQWLDAIWQIWRQFPTAFEFNEKFLIELYEHVFSCLYGTFLSNTQKERADLEDATLSIWPILLSDKLRYLNTTYDSNSVEELESLSTHAVLWHVHIAMADPICFKYDQLD